MSSIKNIFTSFAVSVPKSSKHVSTQYFAAYQKSSQLKEGFSGDFGIKMNLTIHYSLFKHGSTVHGYYSRFLFCLFKEARSSFVSTLHFNSVSLPSLCSPFSFLSLSSCKPFKLSSFLQAFLPLSIVRYFSLCII